MYIAETDGPVMPIKGKPKSGRLWKSEKSRFRSMCQVKPLKSKWDKRLQQRQERKDILAHQAELKEIKDQEKEDYCFLYLCYVFSCIFVNKPSFSIILRVGLFTPYTHSKTSCNTGVQKWDICVW
ncbi:hypothetical protein AVEN_131662-1 [Araneus ventricosus]|uniref:Coiled-coil domain-containing protein 86 n=1 Tax=Araneus ventricosus TaxID=182803 RepID=A0A4Y2R7U3_ARAVE|nr:hypothetical protein AVEN_131662-1 [Araneus ventricosus]